MRLGCVIVALVFLAILVALLLSTMWWALDTPPRVHCKYNLKQIGTACQNWASAHWRQWPDVFDATSTHWNDVGNTRTDEWVPGRDPSEPARSEPSDNGMPIQSNTANLWRLIISAGASPAMFVCPDSGRRPPDVVSLYDASADEGGPGFAYGTVRDFRGELYCQYSFQNVLGLYTLTQTCSGHPARFAVVADASPLRRDFWSGAPGGVQRGATDKYLDHEPEFVTRNPAYGGDATEPWCRAGARPKAWELNSPNHNFEGMNVLFLDGHVEWVVHPYCGVGYDNIWLRRKDVPADSIDPANITTLRAANDPASYNGTSTLRVWSQDDSFLVP